VRLQEGRHRQPSVRRRSCIADQPSRSACALPYC
jgi:hypothetical protein